jgi:hypothetical protein
VAERVVALTLAEPPAETTYWTADPIARASGISASAVRRILKAHGLQPHRCRQFKISNDPQAKLCDVFGLYVDPPAHAAGRKYLRGQLAADKSILIRTSEVA